MAGGLLLLALSALTNLGGVALHNYAGLASLCWAWDGIYFLSVPHYWRRFTSPRKKPACSRPTTF